MKFGKVDNPGVVNFELPLDHLETKKVLSCANGKDDDIDVFVGCAKWNKTDLKGFYPKGIKDELTYYSSQFNSIEFNASFYRMFPLEQYRKWKDKTPQEFKFFTKVSQQISHIKRLNGTQMLVDEYTHAILGLEDKLGCVFLQLHENFGPENIDRVVNFMEYWPNNIPLALEFRHGEWYNNEEISKDLCSLLRRHNISNIITDTAGRRDLLHMRLTNKTVFIRYVGANHSSDYERLDDWVIRLSEWKVKGIEKIYFFIHQNIEQESPLLASYFIRKINSALGTKLKIPVLLESQHKLFE